MAATAQPASSNDNPFASYAKMPNYEASFAEAKNVLGIDVSDDDKRKAKTIISANLSKLDGGSVVGSGLGFLQTFGYYVMATFKAIGALVTTGDWSSCTAAFNSAIAGMSSVNKKGELWPLQQSMAMSCAEMKDAGINPVWSDFVTGTNVRGDTSSRKVASASILKDVATKANIGLPVDTDTSLDAKPTELASLTPISGLPRKPSTQGLTPGA